MKPLTDFSSLRDAFQDGSIFSSNVAELQKSIAILTESRITNDNIRHIAGVMSDTLHNLLIQHILDEQEKRNKKAQFWFMVLAIGGLIAAIIQVLVALLA